MHVTPDRQNGQAMETPTGEVIFELIGEAVTPDLEAGHSLARIRIPSGKSSSLHYHKVTKETYYIIRGEAGMQVNGEEFKLLPGQVCYLEPGDVHKVQNHGKEDLEFLAYCVPAWVPDDSFDV